MLSYGHFLLPLASTECVLLPSNAFSYGFMLSYLWHPPWPKRTHSIVRENTFYRKREHILFKSYPLHPPWPHRHAPVTTHTQTHRHTDTDTHRHTHTHTHTHAVFKVHEATHWVLFCHPLRLPPPLTPASFWSCGSFIGGSKFAGEFVVDFTESDFGEG